MKYEFIKGSIFNTEHYKVDALVVFVPCGLTFLRFDSKKFISNNGDFLRNVDITDFTTNELYAHQFNSYAMLNGGDNTIGLVDFKLYKNKRFTEERLQHFIVDENIDNKIYGARRLPLFIDIVLSQLSSLGAKRIAMNGVRTPSGSGYSEKVLVQSVDKWLRHNKEHSIEEIFFIDKRDGFNKKKS